MSDIAKWGLLITILIATIAVVTTLPVVAYINIPEFNSAIDTVVDIAGDALLNGRNFINIWLSNFGISLLNGVMYYLFAKFIVTNTIQFTTLLYRWIFK